MATAELSNIRLPVDNEVEAAVFGHTIPHGIPHGLRLTGRCKDDSTSSAITQE
jgi:hypothetical protein